MTVTPILNNGSDEILKWKCQLQKHSRLLAEAIAIFAEITLVADIYVLAAVIITVLAYTIAVLVTVTIAVAADLLSVTIQ